MKKSFKFNGKINGLYDFVYCTSTKSIDDVQSFLESKGWEELEFVSLGDLNGYETYDF